MYYDEFVEVTECVTSEFIYGILDCLQHISCVQNHFLMRQNYQNILKKNEKMSKVCKTTMPKYQKLPKPLSEKFLD